MDLLKTPSVQSLLDSDLESVGSLQYMDFEELDEVEYALPSSEAPTLAEVLSAEDEGEEKIPFKPVEEPSSCSAVQIDFMQAVSQQIIQAQERSLAGAPTALSVGSNGKLTVGTAHGHLLSFFDQTLRWVCDSNTDRGAVSCLAYNQDSTRLLAGYARGVICQYDSIEGVVLRRVTLGGEIWGTLRVTWAGMSGLALDTGGSVWLIKFSRPLGVRSARSSCLFSGARGEVVAMAARDARILALATLSRVIIVAGGRAAGVRLGGPPDTLPVLAWSDTDERILVCGRSKTLQWLAVNVTGSSIVLRPIHRVELKSSPLWLGWLGGNLAIFDADENLRLWGDDYDKPLDLSQIEPVYASAFFKGLWTDGRVSRAMCMAGGSALGGACVAEGSLSLLGRRGVVRVRPRDLLARAQASMSAGRHAQALRLLCSAQGPSATALADSFIVNISERPHLLSNKVLADLAIKLCLKFNLGEELWSCLWEQCAGEKIFVEALGEAAVRGELYEAAPSPDCSQELIERLANCDPGLVERVVASLPLTSLDPHRASVFTRDKGLWRGVGAIAAALGGPSGAMRELVAYVDSTCIGGPDCRCAGGALLLAAADALAGRGAGGRPLPDHAQPSARHDALHTLLAADAGRDGKSPLRVLAEHDARACVRLLEQSAREPPFVGPLGKQNRLRVARALLDVAQQIQEAEERAEILEFITGQLSTGALPGDRGLLTGAQELAAATPGERADRAWLALLLRAPNTPAVSLQPPGATAAPAPSPPPAAPRDRLTAHRELAVARPRVLWRLDVLLDNHPEALSQFFQIENPSEADIDELFRYLESRMEADAAGAKKQIESHLSALIELRPRAAAALVNDELSDVLTATLRENKSDRALEFAEGLLEAGRLRGDAAAAHFGNLCARRPAEARAFLVKHPGAVRPEHALATVRGAGAREAEPECLEATGDPGAALEVLLDLVAEAEGEAEAALLRRACELCTRVAPGMPTETASALWARLLRRADSMPAALLLEAAAYLPAERLAERVCAAPRVAHAVLGAAAVQRRAWECAARVAKRETHEALALALASARRGLAVRGRCTQCGRPLAAEAECGGDGARTTHCARACHVACVAPDKCPQCGRKVCWRWQTCGRSLPAEAECGGDGARTTHCARACHVACVAPDKCPQCGRKVCWRWQTCGRSLPAEAECGGDGARTTHCARACHVACVAPDKCPQCGRKVCWRWQTCGRSLPAEAECGGDGARTTHCARACHVACVAPDKCPQCGRKVCWRWQTCGRSLPAEAECGGDGARTTHCARACHVACVAPDKCPQCGRKVCWRWQTCGRSLPAEAECGGDGARTTHCARACHVACVAPDKCPQCGRKVCWRWQTCGRSLPAEAECGGDGARTTHCARACHVACVAPDKCPQCGRKVCWRWQTCGRSLPAEAECGGDGARTTHCARACHVACVAPDKCPQCGRKVCWRWQTCGRSLPAEAECGGDGARTTHCARACHVACVAPDKCPQCGRKVCWRWQTCGRSLPAEAECGGDGARTTHCARACHVACVAPDKCPQCGRKVCWRWQTCGRSLPAEAECGGDGARTTHCARACHVACVAPDKCPQCGRKVCWRWQTCGRSLPAEAECGGDGARTTHCARACHVACVAPDKCPQCGRKVPEEELTLPPAFKTPQSPMQDHQLQLVAPPRPDLEGIV